MIQKKNQFSLELFEQHFSRPWIDELSNNLINLLSQYDDSINQRYFPLAGNYGSGKRNDNNIDKNISDYFNRLLYAPNIAILDYTIKNLPLFQNLKFIDNGAGFGILSIFLKKLNIDCYNYDNFSQISKCKDDKKYMKFFKKYNVPVSKDIIPNDIKFDVLTSSAIWVDNKQLMNIKYIMIDTLYMRHKNNKLNFKKYSQIGYYNNMAIMYKLKD